MTMDMDCGRNQSCGALIYERSDRQPIAKIIWCCGTVVGYFQHYINHGMLGNNLIWLLCHMLINELGH